jgi:hypothetical protein
MSNATYRASAIDYLDVHICSGKSLSFDTDDVKRSFFAACICAFASSRHSNELVQLSPKESYSPPVLQYATSAMNLSIMQSAKLSVC